MNFSNFHTKEILDILGYTTRDMTPTKINSTSKGVVLFPTNQNDNRSCIAFCNESHMKEWLRDEWIRYFGAR